MLTLLALAACSGDDGFVDGPHDSGPPPPDAAQCIPIADTWCFGEMCTWIRVTAEATPEAWRIACVLLGSQAEGEPCGRGPVGETTGHDNCGSGLFCVDNACRRLCTLSPDSCDLPAVCVNPNDNVAIGASTEFGYCE